MAVKQEVEKLSKTKSNKEIIIKENEKEGDRYVERDK